jgi:hypothetical protein
MLLEIQRVFVMLQESKSRQTTTEGLTKSFGWDNADVRDQQDVHELNRVLFDAIETALEGTPYDSLI